MEFEINKTYEGDVLDVLKTFPSNFVNCVVTSPPYWALRDYQIPPTAWPKVRFAPMTGAAKITVPAMTCCHGLEPDPISYVAHEVLIFRQVHRILRTDGTMWINLGDSYFNVRPGAREKERWPKQVRGDHRGKTKLPKGYKQKDLCMIPQRVALALQADGWFLRADIIWSKTNPMPESVKDRPMKSHENIYLLAKSRKYLYDADAIREPFKQKEMAKGFRGGAYCNHATFININGGKRATTGNFKLPSNWDPERGHHHGAFHRSGRNGVNRPGFVGRSDGLSRPPINMKDRFYNEKGRNKRSVWSIATAPYRKAHFATFPPKLIQPCILAGCPRGGIVMDIFMGSGTTAKVANDLGRNYLGVEIKADYIKLQDKRMEQPVLIF